MSGLHLGGVPHRRLRPIRPPTHASLAEATIAAVLAGGAVALSRGRRLLGVASTAFAFAGFVVGINFTVRGGDTTEVA